MHAHSSKYVTTRIYTTNYKSQKTRRPKKKRNPNECSKEEQGVCV